MLASKKDDEPKAVGKAKDANNSEKAATASISSTRTSSFRSVASGKTAPLLKPTPMRPDNNVTKGGNCKGTTTAESGSFTSSRQEETVTTTTPAAGLAATTIPTAATGTASANNNSNNNNNNNADSFAPAAASKPRLRWPKLEDRTILAKKLEDGTNGMKTIFPFLQENNWKDYVIMEHIRIHKPYAAHYGAKHSSWEATVDAINQDTRPDGVNVFGCSLKKTIVSRRFTEVMRWCAKQEADTGRPLFVIPDGGGQDASEDDDSQWKSNRMMRIVKLLYTEYKQAMAETKFPGSVKDATSEISAFAKQQGGRVAAADNCNNNTPSTNNNNNALVADVTRKLGFAAVDPSSSASSRSSTPSVDPSPTSTPIEVDDNDDASTHPPNNDTSVTETGRKKRKRESASLSVRSFELERLAEERKKLAEERKRRKLDLEEMKIQNERARVELEMALQRDRMEKEQKNQEMLHEERKAHLKLTHELLGLIKSKLGEGHKKSKEDFDESSCSASENTE